MRKITALIGLTAVVLPVAYVAEPAEAATRRYTVSGKVFSDSNRNGKLSPGEKALTSRKVQILNSRKRVVANVYTNRYGNFYKTLPRGTYTVRVSLKAGEKSNVRSVRLYRSSKLYMGVMPPIAKPPVAKPPVVKPPVAKPPVVVVPGKEVPKPTPTKTVEPTTPAPAPVSNVTSNEKFLSDLNAGRAKNGVAPLEMKDCLNAVAETIARESNPKGYDAVRTVTNSELSGQFPGCGETAGNFHTALVRYYLYEPEDYVGWTTSQAFEVVTKESGYKAIGRAVYGNTSVYILEG